MHILNMNLPEDTYNVFKEYYAPEKTLGEQFIIYIRHLSKLDLGYSFYYRMPVSRLIAGRIGWTIFFVHLFHRNIFSNRYTLRIK